MATDRHYRDGSSGSGQHKSQNLGTQTPPRGSQSLMEKLAARSRELADKRATESYKRRTERVEKPKQDDVPSGGHQTQTLRRKMAETISNYPIHEKACHAILLEKGLPVQSKDCVGADELMLTEDHMIVRFDMHVINPADNQRHRFLVDVDMSLGELSDYTITALGPVA